RLRVVDDKDAPIRVLDKEALSRTRAAEGSDLRVELARLEKTLLVNDVSRAIVLDSTPPEGVAFVKPPVRAVRGRTLVLRAGGQDPGWGTGDVLFSRGPTLPGGKVPADAVQATGRASSKDETLWGASLPIPRDQKGPLLVHVLFTNGV